MATMTRRVIVTRRIEYRVPAPPGFGACWAEVMKAFRAARMELESAGIVAKAAEMNDDVIRVHAADDEIVVAIEFPTEEKS